MMKKILFAAAMTVLLLTGCDNSSSVSSSGTATDNNIQSTSPAQDELDAWERDIYVDDLYNKYVQLGNDEEAFYNIYYNVETDDDVNNAIAAAEKCLSTLEALAAVEAPDTLMPYHEALVEEVQREVRYYENMISLMSYGCGNIMLTDEELEQLNTELDEYYNIEGYPLGDAFSAVVDAAAGY